MILETVILQNLLHNDGFVRKTIPFIKREYFEMNENKDVFDKISDFIHKYKNLPTKEALIIEIEEMTTLSPEQFDVIVKRIMELEKPDDDFEWLLDKTEEWCQEREINIAVHESIYILTGKDKTRTKHALPGILSDALSVSFEPNIGHDFFEDIDARYESYHTVEDRISFDITYLNRITGGGLTRKTLNIIMAPTGVGKTLAMCHFASANILDGKNVLYITLEMAEEKIASRIDANLLNVPISKLEELSKPMYDEKVAKVRNRTKGRLIIKEYPTATANASHFRHLLNELKLKKSFMPDVIYIDYLNICSSSRVKQGVSGMYAYVKSIAEELRGLAVEFNLPIVSATQTNRQGLDNSDVGMGDTSESVGVPFTIDLMLALTQPDELKELNQYMVKQLKNRYGDLNKFHKFVIGVDKEKMRLYNVEFQAQDGLAPTGNSQPVQSTSDNKDYSGIKMT